MSQYTLYQSTDVGAPILNGLTGSLLNVLNKVLVTGYGSMPGAGWTKPFEDAGTSGSTGKPLGCLTMPTGSGMTLYINDAGPTTPLEARLTGWESITSMTLGNATGSGQFPTVTQLAIGTGAVICRKSTDTTSTARTWIAYADSRSLFFANKAGDYAATYWNMIHFGDFYSIKSGSRDEYNCILIGRDASGAPFYSDFMDVLTNVTTATTAHFSPRSYTGFGSSVAMGKHSDTTKISLACVGVVTYPNPVDDGLYICPLWVHEPITAVVRGRMRGIWANPHPPASFSDGDVIIGNGEFVGKTFRFIKTGMNGGSFFIETSNTLDTN